MTSMVGEDAPELGLQCEHQPRRLRDLDRIEEPGVDDDGRTGATGILVVDVQTVDRVGGVRHLDAPSRVTPPVVSIQHRSHAVDQESVGLTRLTAMTYIHQEPWPEPPLAADEATAIVAALERQRATIAWKCGGLDADGLRATTAGSTITLGGLLKHLALVEDDTFARKMAGDPLGPPWSAVDWDADPDWEWHSAADDAPDELYGLYRDAVARSRVALGAALADGGLDQPLTS